MESYCKLIKAYLLNIVENSVEKRDIARFSLFSFFRMVLNVNSCKLVNICLQVGKELRTNLKRVMHDFKMSLGTR